MRSVVIDLELAALSVALRPLILPLSVAFSRRERHLTWKLHEACFGAARPGVYRELPLAEIVGRARPFRVAEVPTETYNITPAELISLLALVSVVRASTIFEIGTANGSTTRNLAANLIGTGRVYTLNLPQEGDRTHNHNMPVGCRFIGTPEADSITQLWGDSRTFDFTPFHGRCQAIFIDADHSEQGVEIDSASALHLVDREAGVIVWHDALRFGVQRALPRLMRRNGWPVRLVQGTNLAVLCFASGQIVEPERWRPHE